MPKKGKKADALSGLPDSKLWKLVRDVADGRATMKKVKARVEDAQAQVVEEMQRRRSTAMTGEVHKFTVTQKETMDVDEAGVWKDLTPNQRAHCFDRVIDFSGLTPKQQKKVMKALREVLPADVLRDATIDTFNAERTSLAVQSKKVDAAVIAKHTTFTPQKPYITVTSAGSE